MSKALDDLISGLESSLQAARERSGVLEKQLEATWQEVSDLKDVLARVRGPSVTATPNGRATPAPPNGPQLLLPAPAPADRPVVRALVKYGLSWARLPFRDGFASKNTADQVSRDVLFAVMDLESDETIFPARGRGAPRYGASSVEVTRRLNAAESHSESSILTRASDFGWCARIKHGRLFFYVLTPDAEALMRRRWPGYQLP